MATTQLNKGALMIVLLLLLSLAFTSSDAPAQSPYYQGKTVTVISTSSTGSAYDIYARLVAQFMGKHIPGNPSFIAQNMPGAGSSSARTISMAWPKATARS